MTRRPKPSFQVLGETFAERIEHCELVAKIALRSASRMRRRLGRERRRSMPSMSSSTRRSSRAMGVFRLLLVTTDRSSSFVLQHAAPETGRIVVRVFPVRDGED